MSTCFKSWYLAIFLALFLTPLYPLGLTSHPEGIICDAQTHSVPFPRSFCFSPLPHLSVLFSFPLGQQQGINATTFDHEAIIIMRHRSKGAKHGGLWVKWPPSNPSLLSTSAINLLSLYSWLISTMGTITLPATQDCWEDWKSRHVGYTAGAQWVPLLLVTASLKYVIVWSEISDKFKIVYMCK